MTVILIVAWFAQGEAPNRYQTVFHSVEACESERLALVEKAKQAARLARDKMNPPAVSAFCVVQ